MQECIKAVHLEHAGEPGCDVRRFGPEHAKKVQKFHESFPEYTKTPLAHLSNPVFRRSTMKVPTFSNSSLHLKSHIYLIILDFTGKFNVLTGHFFIEKIFDMLYNNSTT